MYGSFRFAATFSIRSTSSSVCLTVIGVPTRTASSAEYMGMDEIGEHTPPREGGAVGVGWEAQLRQQLVDQTF